MFFFSKFLGIKWHGKKYYQHCYNGQRLYFLCLKTRENNATIQYLHFFLSKLSSDIIRGVGERVKMVKYLNLWITNGPLYPLIPKSAKICWNFSVLKILYEQEQCTVIQNNFVCLVETINKSLFRTFLWNLMDSLTKFYKKKKKNPSCEFSGYVLFICPGFKVMLSLLC